MVPATKSVEFVKKLGKPVINGQAEPNGAYMNTFTLLKEPFLSPIFTARRIKEMLNLHSETLI
jgi:hypothetical protein